MIDQIRIHRRTNENGKEYERVRLWIAGIPFSTDNSEHIEQVVRRFAREQGIEVIDLRTQENVMREYFYLANECIQEAKGSSGDEAYLTALLDEAGLCLSRAQERAERLLKAVECALGYLTGNMDGDMDLGDPVEMLRASISEA